TSSRSSPRFSIACLVFATRAWYSACSNGNVGMFLPFSRSLRGFLWSSSIFVLDVNFCTRLSNCHPRLPSRETLFFPLPSRETLFLPPPLAGGGRGRGIEPRTQRYENPLDDPIGVRQHVVVPEPNDPVSLCFQPSRPDAVRFRLQIVLTAVDLDDQSGREADEIHDVRSKRILPSKTDAADLLASEPVPQARFGIRRIDPHFTDMIADRHPSPYPLPQGEGEYLISGLHLRSDFFTCTQTSASALKTTSHQPLRQDACGERQVGARGDNRLVDRYIFVRPVRLPDDAARPVEHSRDLRIAHQVAAVAGRAPAADRHRRRTAVARRARERLHQR